MPAELTQVPEHPLIKPVLKWVGGKRQLMPFLMGHFPQRTPKTYYEPFIGGGAVLFHLQPKGAIVGDSNPELVNCYEVIRDSVEDLIEELRIHADRMARDPADAEYYYQIRALDRESRFGETPAVERAARIIFLNKTCYNGLFRVNSRGQFNVPFGKWYKSPKVLDEAGLRSVSRYLRDSRTQIMHSDFEAIIKLAGEGDYVYLDPPYDPVSETASFTGYDANGFDRDDQLRLKRCMDDATDRGCKVMQSNASTSFIHELYSDPRYKIVVVPAGRAINSKASGRGKVDEVIILNYGR